MKSKFKRPSWNKAVKVNLTVTECFLDNAREAAKKFGYLNEKEFIIDSARKRLEELGFRRLREPPRKIKR